MNDPAAITVKSIEDLIAKGRFDQALPLCRRLTEQEPFAAAWWFWLGQVQLLGGDLIAAETALKQAVALDASAANSWTDLSLVVLGLGRPTEAEEYARRAIALDASKDFMWLNLGSVLFRQERWAEAAEAFREAVSRGPGNPAAWSNLGLAELRRERRRSSVSTGAQSFDRAESANSVHLLTTAGATRAGASRRHISCASGRASTINGCGVADMGRSPGDAGRPCSSGAGLSARFGDRTAASAKRNSIWLWRSRGSSAFPKPVRPRVS